MYNPKFNYTDQLVTDLGKIEKYKAIIDMSIVPPFIEIELRRQSKLKTTHFSTRIEGNPLSLGQVDNIVEKSELEIKHRSELEVRNYWDALTFLDEQKRIKKKIDEKFIKILHSIIENNNPGRKPKESKYRDQTPPGVLFAVYDSVTKEPAYIPPEAKDVPMLVKELIKWNSTENQLPVPVKAATLSYQFLTIHPFNDGNGRTARALATYLLAINGYDMKGFYSMEEFYAADLESYYRNIQMGLPVLYYDGRNNPPDLTPWIEYFIRIMALAFEKAIYLVESRIMEVDRNLEAANLDKKDKILLNYILDRPDQPVKPKEIAEIFGVTPRAISKWAQTWVEKGLIEPFSGEKRITSYILGDKYKK